ncbi:hypothetical protein T492DRAFT_575656, partial [Pavlovales sp. CCMP2436]
RLWVGNVPYGTTQNELEDLLVQHGQISNVSFRDGFSFVDYPTEEEAETARGKLHDATFNGRRLQVEFARSDGPRTRGERAEEPTDGASSHLYVARIPEAVTSDELQDFFAVYG